MADEAEPFTFPPSVIFDWVHSKAVNADRLVRELEYWANHMAGRTVVDVGAKIERHPHGS